MTKMMENLSKMFPDPQKRLHVIEHAALTYGLTLDDLSNLLGIDANELFKSLRHMDIYSEENLLRRWHILPNLGENRQAKFQTFYRNLYQCYLLRNKEGFAKNLRDITDYYYKALKEKIKAHEKLTDEELLIILKNQIKYTRSTIEIADELGMDRSTYRQRIAKILEKHPEYAAEYQAVHHFYVIRDSIEEKSRR